MAFWWANQGASFPAERELGVLWAPPSNSAGGVERSFSALDALVVGDVVFNYVGPAVVAVSRVLALARTTERPYGERGVLGREVRVELQVLDVPVGRDEIPLGERTLDPFTGSAFNKNGMPNNGYVFALSDRLGSLLLDMAGLTVTSTADTVAEPVDEDGRRRPFVFLQDTTDGTRTVRYRREQHLLRDYLIGQGGQARCDLCGKALPSRLVTTAHIKPRARCSEVERRDPHVVMAACLLACDALFEHGYIVVDHTGTVRPGRPIPSSSDLADAGRCAMRGRQTRSSRTSWVSAAAESSKC